MGAAQKEAKLRAGTFKHIESELYCYWETVQEIKRLKSDIIQSTPFFDGEGGRSNLPGDPTARKVTTLLTHKKLEQLENIVQAIRTVYDQLPEPKQRLIQLKYWTHPQTLTWEGIAQKVHVSRRMALYWRDEIVYAIAKQLGWR